MKRRARGSRPARFDCLSVFSLFREVREEPADPEKTRKAIMNLQARYVDLNDAPEGHTAQLGDVVIVDMKVRKRGGAAARPRVALWRGRRHAPLRPSPRGSGRYGGGSAAAICWVADSRGHPHAPHRPRGLAASDRRATTTCATRAQFSRPLSRR